MQRLDPRQRSSRGMGAERRVEPFIGRCLGQFCAQGVDVGAHARRVDHAGPAARRPAHACCRARDISSPGHSASSACQAPRARSCSCGIVASSAATRCGARCAAASATIDATGLRLCGIADEPPRPGSLGSASSPTSYWPIKRDVGRDLAEAAGQDAEFAAQADPFVALRVPGTRRHRRARAPRPCVAAPTPPCPFICASVPTAPPSCTLSARRAAAASRVRLRTSGAAQSAHLSPKLVTEAGCISVRASIGVAAWRVACSSSACAARSRSASIKRERFARDQRHRGVDHVLAGAAEMHEGHRIGIEQAHRLLQRLDQRNRDAAGAPAVAHDLADIEQLDLAGPDDRLRGRFGNQPLGRLRARQRGLEAQHGRDEVAVAEGGQRFRSGKKAFEDAHVKDPVRAPTLRRLPRTVPHGERSEARSGNTAEPASPGRRCCPLEGVCGLHEVSPKRGWA